MPWVDSLDWSSLNALRRYPIREGSSCLSLDGLFSIPDDFIVDFTLCASSDPTKRFFISRIFNKLSEVVVEISDNSGNIVGTFKIVESLHSEDKDYLINATTRYVGANGKLTVGSFKSIINQPAGVFSFAISSTEFEPRTIIPGIQGVDRLIFDDALNGEYSLSFDIFLNSRNNLRFSYSGSKVYFDAGDNLGLNKDCAITNCVKSINGIVPDPATGNISILGLDCLDISSPALYTIALEDTCCTPCSGCDNLEVLTSRLTSLENKFLDLKQIYNDANTQLATYLSTINSNCACPS